MKSTSIFRLVALWLTCTIALTSCRCEPAPQYTEDWESLMNYTAPEWYEDAKLGFWTIWGVYSVPAFMGNHAAEWYGRWMYCKPHQSSGLSGETYNHHRDTYGDYTQFGYKDFIPMFKAENWDPDQWAELFEAGGAKFFTALGIFHDGVSMYQSDENQWNTVDMGPNRDIVGELAESVRERGLKFGVSNHLGWNYMFYLWNHVNGGDAKDVNNRGLYGEPDITKGGLDTIRYIEGQNRHKDWLPKFTPYVKPSDADIKKWRTLTTELCDKYQPDLYYFDWGFNIEEYEDSRKYFGAHYYNKAIEWGKGSYGEPNVVLNYKNSAFPAGSAVLDRERGVSGQIEPMVWQTDDSVYQGHNWGYAEGVKIKSVNSVIDKFIDIVSKRGVLMLAIAPKADGTIPEDQKNMILSIGSWLKVCGEAIYSTRPWIVSGERCKGIDGKESIEVRFTRSKDSKVLYATMLDWSAKPFVMASVNSTTIPAESIKSVSLIGSDQKVEWSIDQQGMTITAKSEPAYGTAYPIRIEMR